MKVMIVPVLLALMASTAMAENTQKDWDKLAQPIVDDFAQCAKSEVDRRWTESATAEEIAGAAVTSCAQRLEALRPVLADKPFDATEDSIVATLDQLKVEVHEAAQTDVQKRRKGN